MNCKARSQSPSNFIGIDIGGANLKCATACGKTLKSAFPLWENRERLASKLVEFSQKLVQPTSHLAISMTGELADCYRSKRRGVQHIVASVRRAFPGQHLHFYQISQCEADSFVSPSKAISSWNLTAAANWHALARFVASELKIDAGILFDVGSTTCDLIPLKSRDVASQSKCDFERLTNQELFYTGASRTPLSSVASEVIFEGKTALLAREHFSTIADVYVITGDIAEDPRNTATADGRPLTLGNCLSRLARCLCSDISEIGEATLTSLAEKIKQLHFEQLARFVQSKLDSEPDIVSSQIIVSGQGEWLAENVVKRLGLSVAITSLSRELGGHVSEVAPAFALAQLLFKHHTREVRAMGRRS